MKNKSTSGKTPAQIKHLIENPYQRFAYETSVYTTATISILLSTIDQSQEYEIIDNMLRKLDNVDAQQLYIKKRRSLDDLLTTCRRLCKISENLNRFANDIEYYIGLEPYEAISPFAKEIEKLTMKVHTALTDEIVDNQHNK